MSSPIEQNEPKLAKDIRPIELANLTVEATNAVIETKVKTASVEDRRLLGEWLNSQKLSLSDNPTRLNYIANMKNILDRVNTAKGEPSIMDDGSTTKPVHTVLGTPAAPDTLASVAVVSANPAVAEKQNTDNASAVERARVATTTILNTSNNAQVTLAQSAPPNSNPTLGAEKPVEIAKDPKIQALVETYNEQYVIKRNLTKALSRAITNNGGYDAVYERVTGEKPTGANEDIIKFQKSFNTNISFLKQFGGGAAGVDALLSGKTDEYMKEVVKTIKNNGGKMPDIQSVEGISPQVQTIAGAVATVLVAVGTSGIVIVGHEADRTTADTFIRELQKDTEGGVWNKFTNALVWIKEAAMGRKLSITLGANEKEGNVEKYYGDIRNFTKEVMETPDLSKSTNPQVKEMYMAAKAFATNAKINPTTEQYQKALIQSYILNEGYARQGVDWKANIGLLFVGAGREEIKANSRDNKGNSLDNDAEKAITNRKIESAELKQAGVTIEKNSEGKWVHSIPAVAAFAGDTENISITIPGKTETNGTYTIVTDTVQTLHFSDSGSGYVVSFSDATNQPESTATTAAPTGDRPTQSANTVTKFRETNTKNALDDAIYFAGHTLEFKAYLDAMAGQDVVAARATLESMLTGKYRTRASILLKNLNTIDNTYTYGSNANRRAEKITEKNINSIRTEEIINAENKLARKVGITQKGTDDASFDMQNSEVKQASSIYTGQEMTLSVFATPRATVKGPQGALHRIDTMDGSFAINSKTVEITGEYKNQIIDATGSLVKNDKKGIAGQVEKLNIFLKNNKQPETDITKYTNYLKSGNIADLGVPGLQLQEGKGTKVFEARARIAGNLCLNRTHGIVFPLFGLPPSAGNPPVRQGVESVATLDYTTPTKENDVTTRKSALGGSPVAALVNQLTKKPGSPNQPNNPTPTTTPQTGPAVPNNPTPTTTPQTGPAVPNNLTHTPGGPVITPSQPAMPVTAPVTTYIAPPPRSLGPVVK
ncbi:hypothetical protein H7170_01535 [Candidatus Gracilibacteria bacterium]|nr:hypothetical protein [Candidatus Gracilibacteria bacterium]